MKKIAILLAATMAFAINSNAQNRNAGNNTSSDHENYTRGYEDGYDDCCCDHDCSYEDYHDSGYCDRDEYEGIENDECYDDNCGW